jgi:hypothetical protein
MSVSGGNTWNPLSLCGQWSFLPWSITPTIAETFCPSPSLGFVNIRVIGDVRVQHTYFLANVAINAHTRIVATRNRPEYFSLYNSKRNLRIFSVSTVLDVTERDGQTVQFNEPLILTVLVPSAASACINVKMPVMPCTVKCIYDPPSYAEG